MWKEHKFATSLCLTPYPKVLNSGPVAVIRMYSPQKVLYMDYLHLYLGCR